MPVKTKKTWVFAAAISLAAMVVVATAVQAAGKGNKWISLRYNFKPGETLKYGVAANLSGTMSMAGGGAQQTMPVSVKLQTNVSMDVLDVDSEGTATARMKLDEISMDVQGMGQSMEMRLGANGMKMYSGGMLIFDSSQAGGEQLPIGNILGLQGLPSGEEVPDVFVKGVTVTITRLGRVAAPELAAQAGIGGVQATGGLDQLFLPTRLVRPGDRWVPELSIPGMPAQEMQVPGVTFESIFEGVEEFHGARCAKIVTVLDVDPSGLPLDQLGAPQIDLSKSRVQGRGTAYFDIERGRFLRQDAEMSIEFSGSGLPMPMGPAMGAGGASSNMSMDVSMKLKLEIALRE